MMTTLWILGTLAFALILWNVLGWPRIDPSPLPPRGGISVLIPARNEEKNIGLALDLAIEDRTSVREVLVYDDHSTDRTADLIAEWAARDPRVRRLAPQPLPDGWCGKPFACSRLAAEAGSEWLLFLDADARLRPGGAAAIAAEAERRGLTFLSAWPGLDLGGAWERILMPLLPHVVFTLFPAPLALCSMRPEFGLAHGACILVRREEYLRMGGHARVRGEIFEDTALARAWREAGLRGACLDGQKVVRVRMYDSPDAIWAGFQKNAYPAFRRKISFWLFLAFRFCLFLLPFWVGVARAMAGEFCFAAWGAVSVLLLGRVAQALRFGYPPGTALLHPAAEIALLAVALSSWYKCRSGQGIVWKGRTYRGGRR
jgi:glycosyltransferase involved in cell wall biosynthesis